LQDIAFYPANNEELTSDGSLVFALLVPEDPLDLQFRSLLFLPPNPDRQGEGGLRTKGYFRKSLQGKPLITVVTVVLNAEKHLENAIKSVINQTYDNIEYIIIDGKSTDGTVEIIKKYENQVDYWVSEKDSGIYDAMNKSVTLATGDWVLFLGADDILIDSIYLFVQKMRHKTTVYYGNVLLTTSWRIYCGYMNKYKLMQKNICHQAIFYPRTVFENKKYNCKYKTHADHYMNIELMGNGIKFKYLNELICIFNDTGLSGTGLIDKAFEVDKLKIIRQYFGFPYYFIKKIRNLAVRFFKR